MSYSTQLLSSTIMNATVIEVLLQLQSDHMNLQQDTLLNPSPVKKWMKKYRGAFQENSGKWHILCQLMERIGNTLT